MEFIPKVMAVVKKIWLPYLPIIVIGLCVAGASKFTSIAHIEYMFSGYINNATNRHANEDLVIIKYKPEEINRVMLAGLIQSLVDARAKSIALDIDLSHPVENPLDDEILSNVLKDNKAANIILPIYEKNNEFIWPLSSFKRYTQLGFIDVNIENSTLYDSFPLSLETSANIFPHTALRQLGKPIPEQATTYLEPGRNLKRSYYSFTEVINSDTKIYKNKHVLIAPDLKRTQFNALIFKTLSRGVFRSVPDYIVFGIFLAISFLLINISKKEKRLTKTILQSVFFTLSPIIIIYISISLYRIQLPSFSLCVGLLLSSIFLLFIYRHKFTISFKSISLSNKNSKENDLLELLEGEISISKNGVVLRADAPAAKLLGLQEKHLMGTSLKNISPFMKPKLWRKYYGDLIKLKKPAETLYEFKAKHSSGQEISLQLQPVSNSSVSNTVARFILRNARGKSGTDVALEYQAKQDRVSHTLNKESITEHLTTSIVQLGDNHSITILLLNIANFKEINSTLGKEACINILKSFAKRLHKNTSETAAIGRIDSAEFLIVFKHTTNEKITKQITKIIKDAKNAVHCSGISIELDVHAGIANCPKDSKQAETLIEKAQLALSSAQNKNKNLASYDKKQQTTNKKPKKSIHEIAVALKQNQFRLYYQPIIDLYSNEVTSAEALLRWKHPKKGLLRPSEFIDRVEHSKLVRPVTKWVVNKALEDARTIGRYGLNMTISVNISERNLLDAHFPLIVAECINKNKMRAENIEFEISEKNLYLVPEQAMKLLNRFKKNGINFSLDNYGAENTSLHNLKNMPFSKIKIHRSLTSKVIKSSQNEIVIDAIVRLAHGFGIRVVAEGVESELHFKKLRELNCDFCQGNLFSKPVNRTGLLNLFKQWENAIGEHQEPPEQAMATWNGTYSIDRSKFE